jgi:hypothetical protein
LRPNYNSVDLTEVELTDAADSEARGNDTELLFVSFHHIQLFLLEGGVKSAKQHVILGRTCKGFLF